MASDLPPLTPPTASPRADWRFAVCATLVYAACLAPRMAAHVLWRDEWEAWLISNDGCSLPTLFHRVGYEGHPPLWYLLLWAVSRVSRSSGAMQAVHAALASATVFVIAAFGPWRRAFRGLICCGYFFLFEYAVISRNYAPGVLGVMAFAAIVSRPRPSAIAASVALAVAINANALSALLACALAAWYGLRWLAAGRPDARRNVIGAVIVLIALGIAAWQIHGPPDRYNTPTRIDLNPARAARVTATLWRSFVPLPRLNRSWWNTNILDVEPGSNPLNLVETTLGAATFVAALWMLPSRRGVRVLWAGGTLTLLAFGYFKLMGDLRHNGHALVLFLAALWLGADDAAGAVAGERRRFARGATIGLFVAQAIAGVIASIADLSAPFSASGAVGAFIRTRFPDASVIGQIDYTTTGIPGVIGRPVYFPAPGRWGSFVIWDDRRGDKCDAASLARAAREVLRQVPGRPVLLVLSADAEQEPDPRDFRELIRFDDSSIDTEIFAIFEYVGPAIEPASQPATQPADGRAPAR